VVNPASQKLWRAPSLKSCFLGWHYHKPVRCASVLSGSSPDKDRDKRLEELRKTHAGPCQRHQRQHGPLRLTTTSSKRRAVANEESTDDWWGMEWRWRWWISLLEREAFDEWAENHPDQSNKLQCFKRMIDNGCGVMDWSTWLSSWHS